MLAPGFMNSVYRILFLSHFDTQICKNGCLDLMFDVQRLKIKTVILIAVATCTLCVPIFIVDEASFSM